MASALGLGWLRLGLESGSGSRSSLGWSRARTGLLCSSSTPKPCRSSDLVLQQSASHGGRSVPRPPTSLLTLLCMENKYLSSEGIQMRTGKGKKRTSRLGGPEIRCTW
ncbi:hypothetical protein HYDPIDRAFT_119168 [Hydnomerulius pinastri MD-312]|uniref:Uncharacterized protein n=1 Tax=Hydnomerulius pinastri MD-312 TaxID=994086 RepID=A0A0C9VMF1_9AGAM|nr:hypothetical protein HYDPIDRAFT_119168 [Hydnomerulius pinastri MD-312]